nr:hypothetical protein [Tanacetum cinerariifolium]
SESDILAFDVAVQLAAVQLKKSTNIVGSRKISMLDDTWSWVAMGAERQPDAATGAPEAAEPPPPPPAPTRAMPQRMARLEEDIHEIREALAEQHEVIGTMARDFSRFTI